MSQIVAQQAVKAIVIMEAGAGRKVSQDVQNAMSAILKVHPSLATNLPKLLAAGQAKVEARSERTWSNAIARVNR